MKERFRKWKRELKWYPTLTIIFVIIITVIFILQSETAVDDYGMTLPLVSSEPWRLITSHFIHVNESHFISNAIGLVFFGTILEQAGVKKKHILLGILTAMLMATTFVVYSHLIRVILDPSIIPNVVGFSGVIYGLLGLMRTVIGKKAVITLAVLFFLFDMLAGPANIAWSAHLGGLVGGLIVGKKI